MPAQAGNHFWFGTEVNQDNSLTYNENHIISIVKRRLYGVYQRVEVSFKHVFWLEQGENDMFCKYVACIACYAYS